MKSSGSSRLKLFLLTVLTALTIVGMGLGLQMMFRPRQEVPSVPATVPPTPPIVTTSPVSPTPTTPVVPPPPTIQPPRPLTPTPEPPLTEAPKLPPAPSQVLPSEPVQVDTRFGHLRYEEDDPKRLVQVGVYYNRSEFLDVEAASAFNQMKLAAQNSGINLRLISGFRSIQDQKKLFQRQIQRRGSEEAAAKLSAPPGFSEHHTGYAIDIGDEQQPATDLKFEFENTQAYRWLMMYAGNYGFELSFPRNNRQGVSFEPWHWRYVVSPRASQIFAAARSLLY